MAVDLWIPKSQSKERSAGCQMLTDDSVKGLSSGRMNCYIFLLSLFTACAGLKVSVPSGRVIAIRGQPAVLGCDFPPDTTTDLSPLVVTWQRVEDSRVVHSFYYKKDQLDLQSPEYRNRTSLFIAELLKGNATLRIQAVGPRDAGGYLCTVSNNKGTDKAGVQLEYGVLYTEPRLSINITCSSITLLYETDGFPKPEVTWLGEHNEVLSNHTDLGGDAAVGLYHLKSRFSSANLSLKVSFQLKNQLLNQVLHRPVSITYGGGNCNCGFTSVASTILIVLCLLGVLLFVFIIIRRRIQCCRS